MIISHKHNFIFLKTSKTAGTSIEIALSKFCGPNDVITPISSEDEKLRSELGYRGPQNYLPDDSNNCARSIIRKLLRQKQHRKFYNHIKAKKVKPLVGNLVWNNYFKFCVVRNPWDRVVSQYYWRCKSEPRPSISEFLEAGAMRSLKRKSEGVYLINQKVATNSFCRFENLLEDLEDIREKIGLPESLNLPQAKAGYRKGKKNYRDILSESEKNKVAEFFSDEIELLGYKF